MNPKFDLQDPKFSLKKSKNMSDEELQQLKAMVIAQQYTIEFLNKQLTEVYVLVITDDVWIYNDEIHVYNNAENLIHALRKDATLEKFWRKFYSELSKFCVDNDRIYPITAGLPESNVSYEKFKENAFNLSNEEILSSLEAMLDPPERIYHVQLTRHNYET